MRIIAPEYMDEQESALQPVPKTRNPLLHELLGEGPVVEWILPEFLARGSIIAIAGMPGVGKSFFCYTLGLALASATPILGFQTPRPQRVLYFDQENSHPDRIQYERWAYAGLGCPDLELLCNNFWTVPFGLGGPTWAESAKAAVEEFCPDVIFIDTATPACNIQDENDNAEATRAIGNLRMLQGLLDPIPSIIVLKHAKTRQDMGTGGANFTIRGAKAWEGGIDGTMFHTKGEGRPRKDGLNNTKIMPAKTRAFGLRENITIEPQWIEEKGMKGIRLDRYTSPGA